MIKESREHELRHALFANFAAERRHIEAPDTEKILSQLVTLQDHREYAEILRKHFAEYAKNEAISYFGSQKDKDIYLSLVQLGGDRWLEHLEKIREHLWVREDLTPDEKTVTYKQYTGKSVDYLWQIREYLWVARNLFNCGLSAEKAEALLQNTTVDKVGRLARYFGVNPNDTALKIQQEQDQQIGEFSKEVDEFTKPKRDGVPESELDPFAWGSYMPMWERMEQITMLTHPKEAIPSLAKLIEGVNDAGILINAIEGTEVILYMHQFETKTEELSIVRSALKNMIAKRTNDDFKYVRTRAESLIQTIDEVYMQGGVDFIHHPPLIARVAKLMRVPEGQSPVLGQIAQLIELLKGQDALTWDKYFKLEYIDLLKCPEGVPIAIRLAETTSYSGWVVQALGIFESNPENLTSETKKQVLAVIDEILSREYFIKSVSMTDHLRPYVLQVKDEIENS